MRLPGMAWVLLALGWVATDVGAGVYLSRDEALRLAFGDKAVERMSVFLTEDQLARAQELAGDDVEIRSALVTRFVDADGKSAYFDTHLVRTLQETLMVVVTPQAIVERIEILSFLEPREYLPKEAWLEQFRGRELDRDLALKRKIHGITGATLSARAVTEATRRVLATHQAISESAPATDEATEQAGETR
jgi:hypothetical protein